MLLVEQNAAMALAIADHGYVMETGKVVKDGPAKELMADRDIQEFYLGVGEAGRRSFRDVKSYRRQEALERMSGAATRARRRGRGRPGPPSRCSRSAT